MSFHSFEAKALKALMTRIQETVPEIKYIDQDMGQLEGTSTRAAVLFPCVLIDFKSFNFDDLGKNAQQGLGNVIIKFAYAQFTPSSNLAGDTYLDEALKYYEVAWKLNKHLHGWSPGDEFGYMSRRSVDSLNIVPGIRMRPFTYALGYEDYSAAEIDTVSHPDIEIEGEID